MASDRVSFAPRRTTVGRTTAGLMALSYPIVMVVMALAVGPRQAGDLQDVASSFIAAVMLVIALPTSWFLSFDFIEVSRTTVVIFGVVTSLLVAGNPAAVPIAAFLMSVLLVGADALQRTMQIPVEMVFLTQALIVLFVVVIQERFRRGGK